MLDLLPDLCDLYPHHLTVANPIFHSYGGKSCFHGETVTVKCFEDNSRIKELVATNGKGKVMVVDGGGSQRKALLGDVLAEQALANDWEGLVIFGAIRDAGTQATLDIGIQAIGVTPWKTERKGVGEVGMVVSFAGLQIATGDYIYCDLNGVALAKQPLAIP